MAQIEIDQALRISAGLGPVEFLSWASLLRPHVQLSELDENDTVYCNFDPYAYLYFLAREELGRDFRIVRNVQTGPWNGYILQEWLCTPLTRPCDAVLYISDYAKDTFAACMAAASGGVGERVTCYPETLALRQTRSTGPARSPRFAAGYIGRLSEDKGIGVVLEAFRMLHAADRNKRFLIVGKFHDLDFTPARQDGIRADAASFGVVFGNPVPHSEVQNLMADCRCLVFPSTSNVESLGRVILEAGYTGVPVIAARHAGAPDLLAPEALLSPHYVPGLIMPTSTHFAMGRPSAVELARRVVDGVPSVPQASIERRRRHWKRFARILREARPSPHGALSGNRDLAPPGVEVVDLPAVDVETAVQCAVKLRSSIEALMVGGRHADAVFQRLVSRSTFMLRTRRFIESWRRGDSHLDDIGGFPVEACHLVGINPKLRIARTQQRRGSPVGRGAGARASA